MNDQQEREALPPLPEPEELGMDFDKGWDGVKAYGYTADQMHAYASAALAANVPTPEESSVDADASERRCGGLGCDGNCCQPVPEATPAAGPSGSFMTREQAIEFCRNRRPGIEPTEQHIAATIDAYAALFGDLVPAPEATPLKARPDFIAGYDAGLIDGRACERRDQAGATPAPAPQPCGHPASMLLKSAETGEPLYCEACDDKSGRRDAEQRESELMEANRALRAELAEARSALAATPAQAPTEVWEASSKTGRMLFPTEPEARAWVAQFPASVAGGFEVYSVTVYRYHMADQEKEASNAD